MAKYQNMNTQAGQIAVDLFRQLLPGTLEHPLHHLLEPEIDWSHVEPRFESIDRPQTVCN